LVPLRGVIPDGSARIGTRANTTLDYFDFLFDGRWKHKTSPHNSSGVSFVLLHPLVKLNEGFSNVLDICNEWLPPKFETEIFVTTMFYDSGNITLDDLFDRSKTL